MESVQLAVHKIPITVLARTSLVFINNKKADEWQSMGVMALSIFDKRLPFIGHEGVVENGIGMDAEMRARWRLKIGGQITVEPLSLSPMNRFKKSEAQLEKETALYHMAWMTEKRCMFPDLSSDACERMLLDERYDEWIDPACSYLPYFLKHRKELRAQRDEKNKE